MSGFSEITENGVYFRLLREAADEAQVHYGGTLEAPEWTSPLQVRVQLGAATADGLQVEACAEAAPEDVRAKLEGMAARMCRSLVRGARKNGLEPPRRLRRWRKV